MGNLEAAGPLRPLFDGDPWRDALVTKNHSYAYVRRISKAIDRLLQATGWGLSTDGKAPHIDGGSLRPHRRLTK